MILVCGIIELTLFLLTLSEFDSRCFGPFVLLWYCIRVF